MEDESPSFVPVILCGGTGSRLWPYSRTLLPKPFLQLPDGSTMLSTVLDSLRDRNCPQAVIVAATSHVSLCATAVAQAKLACPISIIAEPHSNGTAAAAAAAAAHVRQTQGAQAVLAVMPADRYVGDAGKFAAALEAAVSVADDQLVLMGIEPTLPSTRFGYVFVAQAAGVAYKVSNFVEKPSQGKAQSYIAAGGCYWNAGIFIMRCATYLDALQRHCPRLATRVAKLPDHKHAAGQTWHVPDEFGANLGSLSIDVEVAEKADNLLLLPASDTGWMDLGDWDDFARLLEPDAAGNRLSGNTAITQTRNVNVLAQAGRLVAVAGCDNLNVIDTPDAVLVSAQQDDAAVRKLYKQLQDRRERSVTSPAAEQRPWGNYRQLGSGPGWQVKHIEVNPYSRLSLQSHRQRSEQWTVAEGTVVVTVDAEIRELSAGQSCHIPLGARHRMENPAAVPAVVIEVQSGAYLGEDDIERYEDDFGRS